MTSPAPATCPYGHPLGPGQVRVGWMPCQCVHALREYWGHTTWTCIACARDGGTVVCYDPPHRKTWEQAHKDLQWVYAHLARLVETGATEEEIAKYRRAIEAGEREIEELRERGASC